MNAQYVTLEMTLDEIVHYFDGLTVSEVLVVAMALEPARHLFDSMMTHCRVRQTWYVNGGRRAELENGTIVRVASRQGMRGRIADLVVLTAAARDDEDTVATAHAVVATARQLPSTLAGRVVAVL